MKPTISVIIPTYQHGKTIADCIESLLDQTSVPDEIIVVDDGSNDYTKDVLLRFGNRIKYFYQENHGAPSARMKGFELSAGDLLLFCDADVTAKRDMISKMESALMNNPSASYVYSSFWWGRKKFSSRTFDAQALQRQNFIHTTSLIRREHFPGFELSLKRFQDWDLWLTMLEQGHVGILVPEYLYEISNDRGRQNISNWLPSIMYELPWRLIGWFPKCVKKHNDAKKIIMQKHHLS